ncbi:MAG: sensor histidine kinase [Phycisphaerales bacterium]
MNPTPSLPTVPTHATPSLALNPTAPAPAALTSSDLAELMSAFNAVTGRLQETHDQLRGEVSRLTLELTEANEQLARTKRLAALGEMAAGIAHEVRNPLGSISLFARMLKDDLAERPVQQKLAEKIIASAKGLNAVVGDVLTFSREFRVQKEETCVSEILDRALAACQHDGVEGWDKIEIIRNDQKPASQIALDPSLAAQAMTNIIRNAMEAMLESDVPRKSLTLDVTKKTVADSQGKRERFLGIRVTDSGPGLSDEVLRRMFNPFFTTRKAGTGLGLAIVHRIVDAHGGRVVAANGRSGGAMVELQFPHAAASSLRASGAPATNQRAESSRAGAAGLPMGDAEQNLPLVAIAVGPDRRLSGAA